MANHSISNDQLATGERVTVRGLVAYSRLFRPIVGAEREKFNADGKARSPRFKARMNDFRTLTIAQAQVVAANPQQPSLAEQYVNERLYVSNGKTAPGTNAYSISPSVKAIPPTILQLDDQPGADGKPSYHQVTPLTGDIANGVPVTLYLSTFEAGGNIGMGLDVVAVEQAGSFPYYSGGGASKTIQELGLALSDSVANQEIATPAPETNAGLPTGTDASTGLPGPAPTSGFGGGAQPYQASPTQAPQQAQPQQGGFAPQQGQQGGFAPQQPPQGQQAQQPGFAPQQSQQNDLDPWANAQGQNQAQPQQNQAQQNQPQPGLNPWDPSLGNNTGF